jgi:hypothetical protein
VPFLRWADGPSSVPFRSDPDEGNPMTAVTTCPDRQTLEQFALGRVSPEQFELLAEHVERCDRCVATLHALNAGDALVEAMHHAGTVPAGPQASAVTRLMERLCGLRLRATHVFGETLPSSPSRSVPKASANLAV